MQTILDQARAAEEVALDEHREETAIDAQGDVDRSSIDMNRVAHDAIYREAVIGYLVELASPVIAQQNIFQSFAYGWADEM